MMGKSDRNSQLTVNEKYLKCSSKYRLKHYEWKPSWQRLSHLPEWQYRKNTFQARRQNSMEWTRLSSLWLRPQYFHLAAFIRAMQSERAWNVRFINHCKPPRPRNIVLRQLGFQSFVWRSVSFDYHLNILRHSLIDSLIYSSMYSFNDSFMHPCNK